MTDKARSIRWMTLTTGLAAGSLFLTFGRSAHAAETHALFTEYCVRCHQAENMKGGLDFAVFSDTEDVVAELDLWQAAHQLVEDEEMPPEGPQPSEAERLEMAEYFRLGIASVDWSKHSSVKHVTLPRLTKAEYGNTLKELFGIDFKAEQLLLDDGQGNSGFTNDRDSLFISSGLAEQWFDAAEFALGCMLALEQEPEVQHFEAEKMLMTEKGTVPQDLPGGGYGYSLAGAGQRTLYDELVIPADGWYRLSVGTVGINGHSGMRLRIDGEPAVDMTCVNGEPRVETAELLLRAGSHQITWNIELPAAVPFPRRLAAHEKVSRLPTPAKSLPDDAAALVATAAASNSPALPTPEGAIPVVSNTIDRLNRAYLAMQTQVEYLRLVSPDGNTAELHKHFMLLPQRIQEMLRVKSEVANLLDILPAEIDRRLIESNSDKVASNQALLASVLPVMGYRHDPTFLLGEWAEPIGAPGIDWMRVEGPLIPEGAQKRSPFKDDATDALGSFLPLVFRRPLADGELSKYLELYRWAIRRGDDHNDALVVSLVAALTSPSFLFRDELRGGELNDYQLANRLSYFLWLSMPDEELWTLASSGQLRDETVLRGQVQRMIADPKSRRFLASFLGQWLGFAGIGSEHVPDVTKFPAFTGSLSEAMKLEPVLVFEDLLCRGDSLIRLLDSQETFVNAELAALYDLTGVESSAMQRVRLEDENRAGLLGMAAILTTSATPNRTSPVTRGKWVLENLLGRRLAEPPADAGQLDDKAGERGISLREELTLHRQNESCAGCHNKIDPIGFGLESFDAIGRFRIEDSGIPIDASGELPGGLTFVGPAELRKLLISHHQDEFLANLTRRLIAFALGRSLIPQDEGFVQQLMDQSSKDNYRADRLIESIVISDAFRNQGHVEE